MKTPKEFNYDLWTTGEGPDKKYWVRIKSSGEISEVNHKVMMFLRSEEKKLRRAIERLEMIGGNILSLDAPPDEDEESSWLEDSRRYEDDVLNEQEEKTFCVLLTEKQLEVYKNCICEGITPAEFSRMKQITRQSVEDAITQIKKKAKKYFL